MNRDELVRLLGDSPFFYGLDAAEKLKLAREGRLVGHDEGEVLFKPHDPPRALWMVLDGLVEISRREGSSEELEPVAYVGRGSILGESKIITGTPFRSMARFPEGGTTLQWPRQLILRRLGSSPDFSMHYLHNMARRLEGTLSGVGRTNSKLEGNLDHFDFSTILQTVVDSGSTGVLEIIDEQDNTFAAVYTGERLVGPILCGTLSSSEAFLEIFISRPARGRFCFTPLSKARETTEHFRLAQLLIEAARIEDEFESFAMEVPGDERLQLANRNGGQSFDGDSPLRERIHKVLSKQTVNWSELAAKLPYCRARVALAVRDMIVDGVVEVARE